jgi:ribosomal protein L11 methylase PrmA
MQTYKIGGQRVQLAFRDGVGPASPYSLLLAEYPELTGRTVVDIGTGSGLLAIRGAKRVYLQDTYDKATMLAVENAERNGVKEGPGAST